MKPRLMLITSAPLSVANRMESTRSDVSPRLKSSRTLRGIRPADPSIPATWKELFAFARAMPVTSVP